MRKIIFYIGSVLVGAFLMVSGTAYALGSPVFTFGGGTGTTSPSGILAGDNGATNHINTVRIGSNLTWDGTTLSASGGGGTGLATSSPVASSNLLYYNASGAGSATGIATTTLGGSGVVSISNSPVLIGASPAVATLTGGSNGQVLGWLSGIPTWTASSSVAAGTGVSVATAGSVNTITNTGVTSLSGTTKQLTASGSTGAVTLSFPNFILFPGDIQATNASTTNATTTGSLYLTGITASRPLYVDSTGKVTSAGTGTSGNCVNWGANNTFGDAGAVCGSGSGGSFPFVPLTDFGVNTSATSTPLWDTNSIFASSTSATRPAFAASNSSGGPAATFDVGNVGIGSSTPYTKLGVVGTSTFNGDVVIGGDSSDLPNPYLLISTSTGTIFGRVQGDVIDAQYSYNGQTSINVINGSTGNCASATFFADGNNPTLGGYYGTFSFLNDGWTGSGCSITAGTGSKPEAVVLANPTGGIDFVIASTSQNGFADYNWLAGGSGASNKIMTLTNAGSLGIGTTSPSANLAINAPAGNDYFAIGSSTSEVVRFKSGSTPKIGIGTSSPTAALSVSSNSSTVPPFIVATTTGATVYEIDQNGHHIFTGPKPTCGTGCSSVVGNDNGGTITTGAAVTAVTLNFANTWNATPTCTVTDTSTALTGDVSAVSTTAFTVSFSAAITGSIYYNCAVYGS